MNQKKKITFLCNRFWEWTKYFLEVNYTWGTSTPHIPESDSAFLGIYLKMIPFLLFILCKCFFWEQLSQLYPQLELWMKSRSNMSSFCFCNKEGGCTEMLLSKLSCSENFLFIIFLTWSVTSIFTFLLDWEDDWCEGEQWWNKDWHPGERTASLPMLLKRKLANTILL